MFFRCLSQLLRAGLAVALCRCAQESQPLTMPPGAREPGQAPTFLHLATPGERNNTSVWEEPAARMQAVASASKPRGLFQGPDSHHRCFCYLLIFVCFISKNKSTKNKKQGEFWERLTASSSPSSRLPAWSPLSSSARGGARVPLPR